MDEYGALLFLPPLPLSPATVELPAGSPGSGAGAAVVMVADAGSKPWTRAFELKP